MRSGVLGVRSPGVAGATSRVRTATRRSSGVSEKGKPGLVEETAAQHAARHPVLDKTCARCVYHASRAHLERTYGSYAQHGDTFVRRHVWLAARPVRLGGFWAVGCVFCGHLRQAVLTLETTPAGKASRSTRMTAEVPAMQTRGGRASRSLRRRR